MYKPTLMIRRLLVISISFLILFPLTNLVGNGKNYTLIEKSHFEPSLDPVYPTRAIALDQNKFMLVVLPDSQYLSRSFPHIYTNQTEWIVNNSAEKNMVYVLHEGDITNNNNHPQWTNANNSQRKLDGHVPYTLSPGNHDLGPNGNAANRDTYMNDYFNLTEYQAYPTFGGAFEQNKIENTYHLFSAGGLDWMIVSLEFAPRDAVLAWANEVVANHTDRIVFVITHNYLAGNVRNPGYGGNYGLINDPVGAASGEDIWQNFVKKHRNIMCVFCGHILVEAGYLASTGDHGNTVHQMLANFQMNTNGGNGYMRLVEFDTAAEQISVKTYSPYLDQYKTSSQHQFVLNYKKWNYINDRPVIKNNITFIELDEDGEAEYLDLDGYANPETGIFEDPNTGAGDDLTFYIWTGYNWRGLNENGKFENNNLTAKLQWNDTVKIEPKENKYGSDAIKLKAVDTLGDYITTEIPITIHPVNDRPVINATANWIPQTSELLLLEDKVICFEDRWANFTVTAYDPIEPEDGSNLSFSVNSSDEYAGFFNIDENTGSVSLMLENEDVGIYYLRITVTDGGEVNDMDEYDFMLEVNNTNDPPSIITTDIVSCIESDLFYVEYQAEDCDPTNDTFVWELYTNASFLSMHRYIGSLSGIPRNADVGSYFVNITVSDRIDGIDFTNFTLTVKNVNDPPMINNSISYFTIFEDSIDNHIDLHDWFTDVDSKVLHFRSIGSGSENISVDILKSGLANIEPKANWSGKETLMFYVNDSLTEVNDTVEITVSPVNDLPFDPTIVLFDIEYYEKREQPASGNATDVDIPYGDKLYFTWSSNVTGSLGQGQEINLSLTAGMHTITLTVKDKEDAWVNVSTELEILKITDNLPDIGKDDDEDGSSTQASVLYIGVALGAVVIIIILIIMFLFFRQKMKKKVSLKEAIFEESLLRSDPRAGMGLQRVLHGEPELHVLKPVSTTTHTPTHSQTHTPTHSQTHTPTHSHTHAPTHSHTIQTAQPSPQAQAQVQQPTMPCPLCQKEIQEYTNPCPHCGGVLQ